MVVYSEDLDDCLGTASDDGPVHFWKFPPN